MEEMLVFSGARKKKKKKGQPTLLESVRARGHYSYRSRQHGKKEERKKGRPSTVYPPDETSSLIRLPVARPRNRGGKGKKRKRGHATVCVFLPGVSQKNQRIRARGRRTLGKTAGGLRTTEGRKREEECRSFISLPLRGEKRKKGERGGYVGGSLVVCPKKSTQLRTLFPVNRREKNGSVRRPAPHDSIPFLTKPGRGK